MACGHPSEPAVISPRGVTLAELMVVLAVLGIVAGVAGLAWRRGTWTATGSGRLADNGIVAEARRQAVATGASVTVVVQAAGTGVQVLALPDGRVVGADALGYDPLSGRPVMSAGGRR